MNIRKNIFCSKLFVAVGAATLLACTDTWNDHYTSSSSLTYDGTLMKAIESEAPDFAQVIKAVGYDRELNSENSFTIWAPLNFNKDSVLQIAKKDSAAVVDKFLKNHIARFAISENGSDQSVSLISKKKTTMTSRKFDASNLVSGKTNLLCNNGILHVIDSNINYKYNIYELIENLNANSADEDKTEMGGSLYAFLNVWNTDSLDENKSVSRGVDADGNKIWVDSFTIRNNTVLKNVDAKIYEEDSSYIAIIPSNKAWKERYEQAKELLKYNKAAWDKKKGEGWCDSVQNYYANMFAMADLYYNKNANEHFEDSLKSTIYRKNKWWEHVYYSKEPKVMPEDTELNDILSKCGTPVSCSNGEAYIVDEYPMTPFESYFKKIELKGYDLVEFLDRTQNDNTSSGASYLYSKSISNMESLGSTTFTMIYELGDPVYDEDSVLIDITNERSVSYTCSYVDFQPTGSANPYIAFQVPQTFSGTYDMYLVTCPMFVKTKDLTDERTYRFNAYLWERQPEDGKKPGEYPSSGTKLVNPNPTESNKNIYVTSIKYDEDGIPLLTDTTFLGTTTFTDCYYNADDEGVLVQINTQVTSKQQDIYSREMLISSIIFKPHDDSKDVQELAPVAARKRNTNHIVTLKNK